MHFGTTVRIYDTIYATQGLQVVAIFVFLGIIGYLLFWKKKLTYSIKLWLWALAVIWAACNGGLYVYSLHNYFHDTRPLLNQQTVNK